MSAPSAETAAGSPCPAAAPPARRACSWRGSLSERRDHRQLGAALLDPHGDAGDDEEERKEAAQEDEEAPNRTETVAIMQRALPGHEGIGARERSGIAHGDDLTGVGVNIDHREDGCVAALVRQGDADRLG